MVKKKIIPIIIAAVMLLAIIAAFIDLGRVAGGNAPLFCISTDGADCIGLGYGFYIERPPVYSGSDNGSYIFHILGIPVVNRLVNGG